MERSLLLALQYAGVDTEGAVARFAGNVDLYIKFLKRLPEDDTFEKIQAALEQKDWNGMLASAHTLKGISGNLGINRLYAACSETVRLLRENDPAAAQDSCAALEAAYQEICFVLRRFEEGDI